MTLAITSPASPGHCGWRCYPWLSDSCVLRGTGNWDPVAQRESIRKCKCRRRHGGNDDRGGNRIVRDRCAMNVADYHDALPVLDHLSGSAARLVSYCGAAETNGRSQPSRAGDERAIRRSLP